MKHLRRFLLPAMGVIALWTAIAGTTGSVNGFLQDDMGMPVVGAKVTLVDIAKGFASQDRPFVVTPVDSLLRIDRVLEAGKDPR